MATTPMSDSAANTRHLDGFFHKVGRFDTFVSQDERGNVSAVAVWAWSCDYCGALVAEYDRTKHYDHHYREP